MSNLNTLVHISQILEKYGITDLDIGADHDIIYLLVETDEDKDAAMIQELRDAGARHNEDEGWYVFV